jgi:hypothetical protein
VKTEIKMAVMATAILAAAPTARADLFHEIEKGAQWVGDRTGLKRPFEEVTGLAEEKRTQEARQQAQEAEADAARALAELEIKKAELKLIEAEFEKFKAQANLYRSEVRKLVTPVNAKLLQMSITSQVITDSHQELLSYSAKANTQIEALNTALSHLVQTSRNGTLISEEDRALVRILQLAVQNKIPPSDDNAHVFEASLDLVSNRGRALEEQLQIGFREVHKTFKLGQWISSQSKFVHEGLLTLSDQIKSTSRQVDTLTRSSLELDKKVKQ